MECHCSTGASNIPPASVVSVMVNAVVIGQSQCREMTVQEAWTSAMLPFAGMPFNEQNNQCAPRVRPRKTRR